MRTLSFRRRRTDLGRNHFGYFRKHALLSVKAVVLETPNTRISFKTMAFALLFLNRFDNSFHLSSSLHHEQHMLCEKQDFSTHSCNSDDVCND